MEKIAFIYASQIREGDQVQSFPLPTPLFLHDGSGKISLYITMGIALELSPDSKHPAKKYGYTLDIFHKEVGLLSNEMVRINSPVINWRTEENYCLNIQKITLTNITVNGCGEYRVAVSLNHDEDDGKRTTIHTAESLFFLQSQREEWYP